MLVAPLYAAGRFTASVDVCLIGMVSRVEKDRMVSRVEKLRSFTLMNEDIAYRHSMINP